MLKAIGHFSDLFDFLYAVAHKLGLYIGVGVGVIYFLIAYFLSITDAETTATVTVVLVAGGLLFGAYGGYREERTMRRDREQDVRVTATLGSLATNIPDPGPDRTSLTVQVIWEVWGSRDILTDRLALNLIHVYEKPWWRFWKETRFPQTGIPPQGQGTHYRKQISANRLFSDQASFVYITDRDGEADPHWELELVLITGMPHDEYRIPVFIDWDEIHSRGTNPPL